jgi:carbohydrate-binding DOMON domain-containing protein
MARRYPYPSAPPPRARPSANTTDGSTPTETSTQYTNPIPLSTNTTLKAIAFATGFDPSYVATASYIFPEVVQNMTQLRNATAVTAPFTWWPAK